MMLNDDGQPAESTAEGLDPAAVRADDAFIESLHGRSADAPDTALAETELGRLVLAWKREIDAEAFPPELDELTVRRALPARARPRMLTPVAAAAAAVGIALSGVALLAHDARPGDSLWGITQVVYADHARSVAAATEAQDDLGLAQRALGEGSPEAARTALERVSTALRSVRDSNTRDKLSAAWTSLTAQLAEQAPPAGPPPTPPAVTTVPPAATVPPVTTMPPAVTVTLAPKPTRGPAASGLPNNPPAPTGIPAPSTAPPASSTAPPAPPPPAPGPVATVTAPAPTSAPPEKEQQPAIEVTPQSTVQPGAQTPPGPAVPEP